MVTGETGVGNHYRVRRRPDRASYEQEVVDSILDEALVCHVGFEEDGLPFVIPMSYARAGSVLFIHGSRSSRVMQVLTCEKSVCIEVTILDGIVLGPDATGHSVNYRSVVAFGTGREVTDTEEKIGALKAIMDHHVPGRWDDIPGPTDTELEATMVAAVTLDEVSAKQRSGSPGKPKPADRSPWCGELPLQVTALEPLPAGDPESQLPVPGYLRNYRRCTRSES